MKTTKVDLLFDVEVNHTCKIADLTHHVMKLRSALVNSDQNKKAKNPFVVWYNTRNKMISCHLMGEQIQALSMEDLWYLAEKRVCEIHNEIYSTEYISMYDLTHSSNPEDWTYERLLSEYKMLNDKIKGANAIIPKKRKYTKRKTTIKNGINE